jgi:glycosyltransferase involved in cell wall biosynthesis
MLRFDVASSLPRKQRCFRLLRLMENSKPMRWWIVEDALRDHKGHWFEYLRTFQSGLAAEGDQVRFFASRECVPEVAAAFEAEPVLPKSIWARISDGASKWRRLLRIPAHALGTYRAVSRLVDRHLPPATSELPDVIFVPTVLVHHLAGWLPLIRHKLRNVPTRILLFFPNTPLEFDSAGEVRLAGEPTAKLFRWYIRRLAADVAAGKVLLGAETRPMAKALSDVTGVPFTYLPHPVDIPSEGSDRGFDIVSHDQTRPLLFGAYGAARADKGSDLLQKAIRQFLEECPELPVSFALQWIRDFYDSEGRLVKCDPWLRGHPKVTVIDDYFIADSYQKQVAATGVMMLPYGSAYNLRVSRVAVEAIASGIPIIAITGTSVASQALEFEAGIVCDGPSIDHLAKAIRSMVDEYEAKKSQAMATLSRARAHFSVFCFKDILCQAFHQSEKATR